MARYSLTDRFLEAAFLLPKGIAQKVFKALRLFSKDASHPGLNHEVLSGKADGLHSIRVDQNYRIILERLEDAVTLHFVGSHQDAYRASERIGPTRKKRETVPTRKKPPERRVEKRSLDLYTAPSSQSQIPDPEVHQAELGPLDRVEDLVIGTKKYLPMAKYLITQPQVVSTVTMLFGHLEEIIKSDLPRSASEHSAWWYDPETHSQARAWEWVGWKVKDLNLTENQVTFVRMDAREDHRD